MNTAENDLVPFSLLPEDSETLAGLIARSVDHVLQIFTNLSQHTVWKIDEDLGIKRILQGRHDYVRVGTFITNLITAHGDTAAFIAIIKTFELSAGRIWYANPKIRNIHATNNSD